MSESSRKAKKWKGYVCPDCRHVFRVLRDHDGVGIVCPSCRRMLRLPGEGDDVLPLVMPQLEIRPDEDTDSEVVETDEHGVVKKRRRNHRKQEEIFDETFAEKEEVSPTMIKLLIGTVAVLGMAVIAVLLWPEDPADRTKVTSTGSDPLLKLELPPGKDELELKAEREVVSPKLVEQELLPVYEGFLTADTIEGMSKWVRSPEVALPRMKELYGDEFEAPGFARVLWGVPQRKVGGAVRVTIEDSDFNELDIYSVDEDGWKVDWESWVGWSELAWDEVREVKPTEPVLFRVKVNDVDYYNFDFDSEADWVSYRLDSPDSEYSLYGYVKPGSDLDVELQSIDEVPDRYYVLKIRFPEDSLSDNQVFIDEVITKGWFVPEDPS